MFHHIAFAILPADRHHSIGFIKIFHDNVRETLTHSLKRSETVPDDVILVTLERA